MEKPSEQITKEDEKAVGGYKLEEARKIILDLVEGRVKMKETVPETETIVAPQKKEEEKSIDSQIMEEAPKKPAVQVSPSKAKKKEPKIIPSVEKKAVVVNEQERDAILKLLNDENAQDQILKREKEEAETSPRVSKADVSVNKEIKKEAIITDQEIPEKESGQQIVFAPISKIIIPEKEKNNAEKTSLKASDKQRGAILDLLEKKPEKKLNKTVKIVNKGLSDSSKLADTKKEIESMPKAPRKSWKHFFAKFFRDSALSKTSDFDHEDRVSAQTSEENDVKAVEIDLKKDLESIEPVEKKSSKKAAEKQKTKKTKIKDKTDEKIGDKQFRLEKAEQEEDDIIKKIRDDRAMRELERKLALQEIKREHELRLIWEKQLKAEKEHYRAAVLKEVTELQLRKKGQKTTSVAASETLLFFILFAILIIPVLMAILYLK